MSRRAAGPLALRLEALGITQAQFAERIGVTLRAAWRRLRDAEPGAVALIEAWEAAAAAHEGAAVAVAGSLLRCGGGWRWAAQGPHGTESGDTEARSDARAQLVAALRRQTREAALESGCQE